MTAKDGLSQKEIEYFRFYGKVPDRSLAQLDTIGDHIFSDQIAGTR